MGPEKLERAKADPLLRSGYPCAAFSPGKEEGDSPVGTGSSRV